MSGDGEENPFARSSRVGRSPARTAKARLTRSKSSLIRNFLDIQKNIEKTIQGDSTENQSSTPIASSSHPIVDSLDKQKKINIARQKSEELIKLVDDIVELGLLPNDLESDTENENIIPNNENGQTLDNQINTNTIDTQILNENQADIQEHSNPKNQTVEVLNLRQDNLNNLEENFNEDEMALSIPNILEGIKEFSSKTNEDVKQFIANGDLYTQLASDDLKPTVLLTIKTRLVSVSKLGDVSGLTWTQIKARIHEKFKTGMSFEAAQEKLIMICQKPNESIEAYGGRVRTLLETLNNTLERNEAFESCQKMNESLAIRKFKQNLINEKLRMMALSIDHASLYQAMTFVIEKEDLIKTSNATSIANPNATSNSKSENKQEQQGERRVKKFCNYCKKFNHTIEECRKREYKNNNDQSNKEGSQNESTTKKNFPSQKEYDGKKKSNQVSVDEQSDDSGSDASEWPDEHSGSGNSFKAKLYPYKKFNSISANLAIEPRKVNSAEKNVTEIPKGEIPGVDFELLKLATQSKIKIENVDVTLVAEVSICNKQMKFLIDSGANASMIRAGTIKPKVVYYPKIRYQLTGISGPNYSVKTLGAAYGYLVANGVKLRHQFQIASEEVHMTYDGILGNDFLKYYDTIMNYGNLTITFILPPWHELYENAERLAFEKNYGSELLTQKWGNTVIYKPEKISKSSDLNENISGRRTDRTESGEIGKQKKQIREMESKIATFKCVKLKSVSNDGETVGIPANGLKTLKLNIKCNAFCKSKFFSEGVYTRDVVVKKNNAFVQIFNENETEAKINTDKLNLSCQKLENYDIYVMVKTINTANISTERRIKIITENLDISHCSEAEKKIIEELIKEFNDVFYIEGDEFTFAKDAEHAIILHPNARPKYTKQYKLPFGHREIINEKIKELLSENIIEPSTSPWNSPILLAPKKGVNEKKEFRMCVDFKNLNKVSETRTFPMPDLDEELAKMAGCTIFSTLDIYSAYYQIMMREQDKELTSFQVGNKKYQFKRMPFGLKGAPITWMEYITRILGDLLDEIMAYMDDILVHSKTIDEHTKILYKILNCLRSNNLKIKIQKTRLFCREIKYLSHIINENGVKPDKSNIEAIVNFPRPKNADEVLRFVNMGNYYRKYVKDFAKIATPLIRLSRKGVTFVWSNECQKSFESLKQILSSAPVLAFADHNKTFYISADASFYAVGAYISNEKPPNDRPIEYFSKSLNVAQINYSTTQKELLALVLAIDRFQHYIWGKHFVVYTDHAALTYLFNQNKPGSRLMRWKLLLSEFDFDIIHRPGKGNVVSDCLSRINREENKEMGYFNLVKNKAMQCLLRAITRSRARENQILQNEGVEKAAADSKSLCKIVEKPGISFNTTEFEKIIFIMDNIQHFAFKKLQLALKTRFDIKNASNYVPHKLNENMILILVPQINFVVKKLTATFESIRKVVIEETIPEIAVNCNIQIYRTYFQVKNEFRDVFGYTAIDATFFIAKQIEITNVNEINEILKAHHSTLLGGHRGYERMKNTVRQWYTWPSMSSDIKKFVENCAICEKSKIHKHTHTPLQITSVASAPFEKIYIDFVGECNPNSSEGHKYIMTMTCDLTKYLIAIPVKDCTALTAARTIVENVCLVFNIPEIMVSDNGPAFIAETFKQMANTLEIKHIQTTPYHPQSNGGVERYHRTMGEYLRSFVSGEPTNWHSLLPFFTFSYNSTVHTSTGFSPHSLVFGYDIEIPTSVGRSRPNYNYGSYKQELQYQLKNAQKRAKEMIEKRKMENKKKYDTENHKILELKRNDLVLLLKDTKKGKFDQKYSGPFRVEEIISPAVTKIRIHKKSAIVHNDKLRKCKADYGDKKPPEIPE